MRGINMSHDELAREAFTNLLRIENDINDIKAETERLNNMLEQLKKDQDLKKLYNHI